MMRYKSFVYSCHCCTTNGKGHERVEDKRQALREIAEELDNSDNEDVELEDET